MTPEEMTPEEKIERLQNAVKKLKDEQYTTELVIWNLENIAAAEGLKLLIKKETDKMKLTTTIKEVKTNE
jgi:lipoprotein NlpI